MNKSSPKPMTLLLSVIAVIGLAVVLKALFASRTENVPTPTQQVIQNAQLQDQAALSFSPAFSQKNKATTATESEAQKQVARKMNILKEIFVSKNDNDSRLDSEFKNLSPEMKEALKEQYRKTALEARNERGTMVFLLGRSIKSPNEIAFFRTVLDEPPCLSMADCSKSAPVPTGEQAHLESMNETSLYYPQIMALRMQERLVQESPSHEIREAALNLIREASTSSVSRIAQEARAIMSRLNP